MQSIFSLLRQKVYSVDHCADVLANLACDGDLNLIVYEQCPAQISSIYLADLVGTFTP
jgi:hypothetical protein